MAGREVMEHTEKKGGLKAKKKLTDTIQSDDRTKHSTANASRATSLRPGLADYPQGGIDRADKERARGKER